MACQSIETNGLTRTVFFIGESPKDSLVILNVENSEFRVQKNMILLILKASGIHQMLTKNVHSENKTAEHLLSLRFVSGELQADFNKDISKGIVKCV